MTFSLLNARYERKFVLQGSTLADALAIIRRHPAGFCEAFPQRIVNNVYLDTPTLQAFHDHVSGVSNRLKTRLRWYGVNGAVTSPVLELKLKRGLVSGKISYPVPVSPWNGDDGTDLARTLHTTQLPEAVRPTLRHLEPSLCNRYRRHYFKTMDGKFRLTIDSQLEFGRPSSSHPDGRWLSMNLAPIVIEVKFEARHAEEAALVGNHLPVRLARCSKYILGIQRLRDVL